jgi:hypothetical protein
MRLRSLLLYLVLSFPALGQLAPEQKLLDFQMLAANFAKRYAFTEWKLDALRWDSLNLAPWLARVSQSQSDLEFFEICAEYVAKNQDGHTALILPSDFYAQLPFDVDIYDGKFLVDFVDRKQLAAVDYPFDVGDELVSIDGVSAAELAAKNALYVGDGNPRTVRRVAAMFLTYRPQWLIPRAHQVGDSANVIIRRQSGDLATYNIPWTKSGTPYTMGGPVPVPKTKQADNTVLPYLRTLRSYQNFRVAASRFSTGIDTLKPVFAMPEGFVQRQGLGSFDTLFTGTFTAGGKKIGFLRLPDFEYISSTELTAEIRFLQANTDGLVIDIMRNPGGSGCTVERAMSYLNPGGFYSAGNKIRSTWDLVMNLEFDLEDAAYYGATDEDIAALEMWLFEAKKAYAENRGFTTPLPLCGNSIGVNSAHDKSGNEIAYGKPILVLTDELSASAAEIFAAVMQDEGRALVYGMRTDGAGGSINQATAGVYMEAYLDYAQSILTRKGNIDTGGEFPNAPYIENIGVRPDKTDDYMTTDNLMNKGAAFVSRFTQAIVDWIDGKK